MLQTLEIVGYNFLNTSNKIAIYLVSPISILNIVIILLSCYKVIYEATSHNRDIFANCPLCKHITDDIQIGKCAGCNQTVYDVNNMTEKIKLKMREYDVKAVPTTIIDGKSKL